MESKLKLSFKKFYEKNLSKEKYINNATLAAQKALDKVRKMREARMFNLSLYKYKGEIKGIKVVAKNPNTPHTSSSPSKSVSDEKTETPKNNENEEMKILVPDKKIIDLVADDIKTVPIKEKTDEEIKTNIVEKEEKKEQQTEEAEEEVIEEKSSSSRKPSIPEESISDEFLDQFMKFLSNNNNKNNNNNNNEVIEEEVTEEPILKRPRKAIPRRRRSEPISENDNDGSISSLKELKQSSQIPSRTPKPARPVKPVIPRRGRPLNQKYVYSEPKIEVPTQIETDTPTPKPKKDYKNNKNDRIKAIHKMTFLE